MRVVGSAGQAQSRPRCVYPLWAYTAVPVLTLYVSDAGRPAPAAARKRKRGSPEVIVEIPAPRRARQSTTNTSQDTIFAETPGRFWADRPPARAANLGSFQDARSASASSQRVVMPPPTAIALLEARLARSKLCSPERLYEDMPYLDTGVGSLGHRIADGLGSAEGQYGRDQEKGHAGASCRAATVQRRPCEGGRKRHRHAQTRY